MNFADKSVSTKQDQTLDCIISGLSQNTPVTWIDPNGDEILESDTSNYVIDQGSFVFFTKASTLTIKQSAFESLPKSSIFKCKLKSAAYAEFSPEVINEMTLTLLELGESKC